MPWQAPRERFSPLEFIVGIDSPKGIILFAHMPYRMKNAFKFVMVKTSALKPNLCGVVNSRTCVSDG